MDSLSAGYAEKLKGQTVLWKRLLDVQAPYRWNLKRLNPGRTLDVGCGIGRNLVNLDGVGVDPNVTCIEVAKDRGLEAFTPDNLKAAPGTFDSLLFAHVLEHMPADEGVALVREYLPYLKPGGQVIMFTPQEAGQASDETHVLFYDLAALKKLAISLGLRIEKAYSFPFGRWAGRLFKYNEFIVTARKP